MKTSVRNNPYSNEAAQEARRATLQQLGISSRETREYSLSKALLGLAEGNHVSGYEKEVSEQIVNSGHRIRSTNGLAIPTGMLIATRDMTAGTPANGGYLVGTQNMSFIDMLRSELVVAALGATIMHGLRGNVTIPKLAAGSTAHWLSSETTAITESQPTIGQLALSPKNVGALTEVSRQLLMQSSPAVDRVIAMDLAKTVAAAVDSACITGSNSGGEPKGLLLQDGLGSVTGTSLDYADILEFMADVAGANALDSERCGYLTTPTVASLLKQRQKVASTYSPIWEGSLAEGRIDGLRAKSSTAMPAASMIFGDFSQIIIGEFGVLEIETNPFQNFAAGIVAVRAIQTIDVGFRNAGAFSVASSIT